MTEAQLTLGRPDVHAKVDSAPKPAGAAPGEKPKQPSGSRSIDGPAAAKFLTGGTSAARRKIPGRSEHLPRAARERKARAARPASRPRRGKGGPVWLCQTGGGAHPSVNLASAAVLHATAGPSPSGSRQNYRGTSV